MFSKRKVSAVRIKKPFSKKIIGEKSLLEIIFDTYNILKEDVLLKQTNSNIVIGEVYLLGKVSYKSVVSLEETLELYLQLNSNINNSDLQKSLYSKGFKVFSLYDILKSDFKRIFLKNYSLKRKKLLEEKPSIGLLHLEEVLLYIDNVPFEEWNENIDGEKKYDSFLKLYSPKFV